MTMYTLKGLTEKNREVLRMRYQYRWRLTRIALELGTSKQSVSKMLQRVQLRAGVKYPVRIKVIRTKPRFLPTQSLSTAQNY